MRSDLPLESGDVGQHQPAHIRTSSILIVLVRTGRPHLLVCNTRSIGMLQHLGRLEPINEHLIRSEINIHAGGGVHERKEGRKGEDI